MRTELVRAVDQLGYTEPTPVQKQAIPVILTGGDAIVGAQTGTGKTASFALPILNRLAAKALPVPRTRVLVLVPTRELAAQVEDSFRTYGRQLKLKTASVFGGVNIRPQIDMLRRGVDILVATPGRLLDHIRNRTVDLSGVEVLVLDEADRMLDMGFIHDIRRILQTLPGQRQNLFFSATFSQDIRRFADSFLDSPAEIEIARQNMTADLVKQVVHLVQKGDKRACLSHLIGAGNWQQVLVFARTKHGANRLAAQLVTDGISAAAIHGNKSQGARTRALGDFKRGDVRVLVATDIAARGLDIKELPHVINYELPNAPEDYVHRIGRTGRAGSNGVAISLVCREETPLLTQIERLTRQRIEKVSLPDFEPGTRQVREEKHAAGVRPGGPAQSRGGKKPQSRHGRSAAQARQVERADGTATHSTNSKPRRTGEAGQATKNGNESTRTRKRRRRSSRRGSDNARQADTQGAQVSSRPFNNALRAFAAVLGGSLRRGS